MGCANRNSPLKTFGAEGCARTRGDASGIQMLFLRAPTYGSAFFLRRFSRFKPSQIQRGEKYSPSVTFPVPTR